MNKGLPAEACRLLGDQLRFWRDRAGISQNNLAAKASVERSLISHIEHGDKPITPPNARRFDEVLDTGGALTRLRAYLDQEEALATTTTEQADTQQGLQGMVAALAEALRGMTGCTCGLPVSGFPLANRDISMVDGITQPIGGECPVHRRQFVGTVSLAGVSSNGLSQLVNPGKIGMTEVNETRETLHLLYNLDQRIGGSNLCEAALAQLRQISLWLNRGSYKTNTGSALQSLASYAAESAAWFSIDSGLPSGKTRYLLTEALTAAELANDKSQTIAVMQIMSLHSAELGQVREAVQLAQRAQQVAKGLDSPRVDALLAIREAQAWARLGDASAVTRGHTQAMKLLDLGPSDADPQWLAFLDEGDVAGQIGLCYLFLRQAEHAEKHFTKATKNSRKLEHRRNFVEWSLEFANSLSQSRKIVETCFVTRETLPVLLEISSARVHTRLIGVLRTLQPYQDEPDVRDLMEQTRELLPAPQTSLGDLPSG